MGVGLFCSVHATTLWRDSSKYFRLTVQQLCIHSPSCVSTQGHVHYLLCWSHLLGLEVKVQMLRHRQVQANQRRAGMRWRPECLISGLLFSSTSSYLYHLSRLCQSAFKEAVAVVGSLSDRLVTYAVCFFSKDGVSSRSNIDLRPCSSKKSILLCLLPGDPP